MTQAPEPNLAGPTRERGAATHGVARLDAATAEARRRAPFRNGVEAGFPESLIRAMSEALDNHGDDPKLRFITFARMSMGGCSDRVGGSQTDRGRGSVVKALTAVTARGCRGWSRWVA